MRKPKHLYPALLLMMLALAGCASTPKYGSDRSGGGEDIPADRMDIAEVNDKKFTMIRVKDDYLEIRMTVFC